MKQITNKEAQEKYGIVVSAMQRANRYKYYLQENGDVVDSDGDIRFINGLTIVNQITSPLTAI